jgi:hypothetical protein
MAKKEAKTEELLAKISKDLEDVNNAVKGIFHKSETDYEKPKEITNIKIGLKGTVKPRSRLGFVEGSKIEFSWEVTNIDSRPFSGGSLIITMSPSNGMFVRFMYEVKALQPNEKTIIDKNLDGTPLIDTVLASGFTLFSAQMNNADVYSPPTVYRDPRTAFMSILGKSKEQVYSLFGLIVAAIGLVGTTILGIVQLLIGIHFI